jgi:hypothetical protein
MRLNAPAKPLFFLISLPVLATGCECIDCNREGPTVAHVRATVYNAFGAPIPGVVVRMDNRVYITEAVETSTTGNVVLEVFMNSEPSDTGTVTAVPPSSYGAPPPQQVTFIAGDTVNVEFTLQPAP